MTATDSEARQAVQTYHRARLRADIPTAAAQLDDDFHFRSPFIESDSPTGHLAGIDQLVQITDHVDLITEFYSETDAVLVYDLHTNSPAGIQRTAEHFRLRAGRITAITLIFDASPWQAIMAAAHLEAH
ncbi:hypothetical protein [Nocardia sp. NPDC020380]|uniref:hypothetical protein n=1 Tax=Nocardia sp. NPDC020380 TaxID=3364309 RepID=UPI00379674C5